MILQSLDAVSEKIAKVGLLCPYFLRGHLAKCSGEVFSCRRTYVAKFRENRRRWRRRRERVFRGKNSTQNIMFVLCYTEGDHKKDWLEDGQRNCPLHCSVQCSNASPVEHSRRHSFVRYVSRFSYSLLKFLRGFTDLVVSQSCALGPCCDLWLSAGCLLTQPSTPKVYRYGKVRQGKMVNARSNDASRQDREHGWIVILMA